jgi:hypothetical protein
MGGTLKLFSHPLPDPSKTHNVSKLRRCTVNRKDKTGIPEVLVEK